MSNFPPIFRGSYAHDMSASVQHHLPCSICCMCLHQLPSFFLWYKVQRKTTLSQVGRDISLTEGHTFVISNFCYRPGVLRWAMYRQKFGKLRTPLNVSRLCSHYSYYKYFTIHFSLIFSFKKDQRRIPFRDTFLRLTSKFRCWRQIKFIGLLLSSFFEYFLYYISQCMYVS